MPRGGARKGAGRKPGTKETTRKSRSIRFTDQEWKKIFALAKEKKFSSAAEYVRVKTLEGLREKDSGGEEKN